MILIYILLSVFFVSLISLIGILTLSIKKEFLSKITRLLVAFAAGSFLGLVFFDLMPELVEKGTEAALIYVLFGIILFFIVEGFVHWHHCHNHKTTAKPLTYVNLLGEAVHNFIDGAVLAAAYLINIPTGIATTAAIVFHEIPQEISDFVLLLHGGFSRNKALLANFLVSLTAVAGSLVAFFFSTIIEQSTLVLLGIAAGGFIYMATTDILPELHKEEESGKMVSQFLAFLIGIAVMFLITRMQF